MSWNTELHNNDLSVLSRKKLTSRTTHEQYDYTRFHHKLADEITPENFGILIENSKRICPYEGNPST
ncbi:MAG: hypothetical protein II877_04205, partial [Synergistaceae bacterium]|nr:hypothetical protein [Synergistaceae bacterium]